MPASQASTIQCDSCKQLVTVKVCRSNKNGNAGRRYGSCFKKHGDGPPCSFFAWADNKTPLQVRSLSPADPSDLPSSPSSSSLLTSSPSTVHITRPKPLIIRLPTLPTTSAALASGPVHCKNPGCKTTRLRAECMCAMCRHHCRIAGGCSAKNHASSSITSSNPCDSMEHNAAVPSPSRSPPLMMAPLPAPGPSMDDTTDMFATPQYASQMTAAFTQQYAHE